jgi:hypothetical protein
MSVGTKPRINAHTAIGEILWLLHAFKLFKLVLELPAPFHVQRSQPGKVMFKLWIFGHQASLDSDEVQTCISWATGS